MAITLHQNENWSSRRESNPHHRIHRARCFQQYTTYSKFCKQSTQYPDIVTSSVPDWMSYDIELLQIGWWGRTWTSIENFFSLINNQLNYQLFYPSIKSCHELLPRPWTRRNTPRILSSRVFTGSSSHPPYPMHQVWNISTEVDCNLRPPSLSLLLRSPTISGLCNPKILLLRNEADKMVNG